MRIEYETIHQHGFEGWRDCVPQNPVWVRNVCNHRAKADNALVFRPPGDLASSIGCLEINPADDPSDTLVRRGQSKQVIGFCGTGSSLDKYGPRNAGVRRFVPDIVDFKVAVDAAELWRKPVIVSALELPDMHMRIKPLHQHTGASREIRSRSLSASQRPDSISICIQSAICRTCAADLAPGMTLATAGCEPQN